MVIIRVARQLVKPVGQVCLKSHWVNILSANEHMDHTPEALFDNVMDYQAEAGAPLRKAEPHKIQTVYFGLREGGQRHLCVCVYACTCMFVCDAHLL